MTLSRSDASSQLDGAGLRAKRALGQNFVVDANTVRRIARLADVENYPHVLEIGAGLGSLTLALAEIATGVTAIEVDEALLPLLNENVGELANVTVVHADAMQLDWPALLGDHTDWVLVANLPYNVATPLIADVLDFVPQVSRMLVMVQKEVADRFAATPSTSAYGALSVKVAFHATARVVGQVPASVFLPRPNVESSLVEITRRTTPLDASVDKAKLFALVRMGFAKRRKMLRGSLAGSVEPQHFEAANIAPTARAEELSVHDWLRLAHILEDSHK
ncbi:MAG: 16S rRNA (adenine(1518)-N(6)/adenine(1519)-N(6))-dimethyltransferase RsmA [Ilumatobacteraceae bacterium]